MSYLAGLPVSNRKHYCVVRMLDSRSINVNALDNVKPSGFSIAGQCIDLDTLFMFALDAKADIRNAEVGGGFANFRHSG